MEEQFKREVRELRRAGRRGLIPSAVPSAEVEPRAVGAWQGFHNDGKGGSRPWDGDLAAPMVMPPAKGRHSPGEVAPASTQPSTTRGVADKEVWRPSYHPLHTRRGRAAASGGVAPALLAMQAR